MKNYIYIISAFAILSLIYSGCTNCSEKEVVYSPFVKSFLGNYNFKMTDSIGNTLVEGIISPKDYVDPNIVGTYTVTNFIESSFKSEIYQSGSFTGILDEKTKKAFVNLNPKVADNNIFLRLEVFGNELKGTWEKSTVMGLKGKGNFNASKN
ncbi:MAG: hypothetical protein WC644_07790 [Ignavibacteria bacterium]